MTAVQGRAASDLLEDALQQFDNLIEDSSNKYYGNGGAVDQDNFENGAEGIGQLIEDLRIAIEAERYSNRSNSSELLHHVQPKTIQFYQDLFGDKTSNNTEPPDSTLTRLKSENDSLTLQVNVLNDQVDLQAEKVKELDSSLKAARSNLMENDERVQKELLARTELETEKLQLLELISNLKIELVQKNQNEVKNDKDATMALTKEIEDLKLQSVEVSEKCRMLEDRNNQFKDLMVKLCLMKSKVREMEHENEYYSSQNIVLQMTICELEEKIVAKENECEKLKMKIAELSSNHRDVTDSKNTKINPDVLQLKMPNPTATSTPIAGQIVNNERLSSPSSSVPNKTSPLTTPTSTKAFVSLTSPTSYTHKEQQGIRTVSLERLHAHRLSPQSKEPTSSQSTPVKRSSSQDNCLNDKSVDAEPSHKVIYKELQPQPFGSIGTVVENHGLTNCTSYMTGTRSTAFQLTNILFEDLRRNKMGGSGDIIMGKPPVHSPQKKLHSETGKSPKSSSTPNLALTNVRLEQRIPEHPSSPEHPEDNDPNPFQHRKKHAFKKFFSRGNNGVDYPLPCRPKYVMANVAHKNPWEVLFQPPIFRLRRSKSGNLESDDTGGAKSPGSSTEGSFRRGGVRATAGPRIGWSRETPKSLPLSTSNNAPFARWDKPRVCDWLAEIGMKMYLPNTERWINSGETLMQATSRDLEKELGIRNVLHKKKLMLAMQALGAEEDFGSCRMQPEWIPRWLDDVGLPQYKGTFQESLIDGNMLHHLTMADLQRLHVSNLLHMLSLRRGIQTLRTVSFDPTKLNRRPVENPADENVALWTNHRVMEWLRVADLAEYAPNLRGSGVHGSLIVLEPLFTSECLANLLQIPSTKTLIRRHLAAKFDELLSNDAREAKKKHNSYVLNITAKVKIGRRSFGPLARLRNTSNPAHREYSSGEYVCPIETRNSGKEGGSMASHRSTLETKIQLQEMKDKRIVEEDVNGEVNSDSGSIEIVELNESTTREIGAFSAELKTLTSKLGQD